MKKSIIFIVLLFSKVLFSQSETKITYISNEGFLVEIDDKKVLIDALYNTIKDDWCDSPSDSIVDLMRKSESPFDDIDIIAITHKHIDHFDESIVIGHMVSNPKSIVICPNQVHDILLKNERYDKIENRIYSVTPEFLSDSNIVVSNIPVRILRLEHSHYKIQDSVTGKMVNKHKDIENLGFVFNINGTKIFHCGDTNPLNESEYSTFSLFKQDIDIAFVERLFFAAYQEEGFDKIYSYINSDFNVLMHIRPANKNVFMDLIDQDSNFKVFENKMESVIITLED